MSGGDGAGRIGLFTAGMWRLRREAAEITGLRPTRRLISARGLAAVAGWGHKPTARRARAAAARAGVPYIALEDGFLRSAAPGPSEPSLSYICDREGVYYDAAGPSALERLVLARAGDPAGAARDAAPALEAMRTLGLSKYNAFSAAPGALAVAGPDPAAAVLVVDQTVGDAAVTGAGAGAADFEAMLIAAATENPGARLLLRTHPETAMGRRAGHFTDAALARACARSPALRAAAAEGRLARLTAAARPRDVFARVGRVYAVSSLMGLEALVAGVPVACFGRAFYAGWGLTDDRAPPTGRRGPAPLASLVAAAYVDYSVYVDPITRRRCSIGRVIEALAQRCGASPDADPPSRMERGEAL